MSTKTIAESERELVEFFRGLRASDRAEYESLAALDRRFGEDVLAERRERAKAEAS